MANENTNLMSISIKTTGSNSGSSSLNSKYKSSSKKGGNDFNAALDRANNTINRQAAPVKQENPNTEDVTATDTAKKNPESNVENKDVAASTTTQGQNKKTQDAPQNVPQNTAAEKNVPAEIDVVPTENILPNVEIQPENIDVPQNIDAVETQEILPVFFTANTESLLPPQITENTGEVNLMAVMPQPDNSQNQSMLNILSGKTWTAEDVQATIQPQQNLQTLEIDPENLNLQQNDKNFTLVQNSNNENPQPQIFTRQTFFNPEQVQIQNPQQNLNIEQTQIQNPQLNLNPEQSQLQNQQVNLNNQQPLILEQNQNLNQIQTQEPLQPTMQNQIIAQEQPILNSAPAQIEPKQVNQTNHLNEFLGVNVQVEENPNVAPLSPLQESSSQQNEQGQQSAGQNFGQLLQDTNPEIQSQSLGGEETFVPNVTPTNNNVTTQPTIQTPNPEATAQAARDAETVPAQIVEQARLIRTAENTEMVINLKPEHLGQLTLRVSVSQNGAVNASFYSDNAQVRAAIENSIVQLKQELSDQGLKVDNVQVSSYLNDSGLMNGQGGQAWQQQQQNQGTNRRIDFDALQDEVDAITPTDENLQAEGVDYKI